VVLMHGTDGKRSGAAYGWEVFLPEAGTATLNLDSYSGRGLQSVSQDQNAFGQFLQIFDAYRAVEVLAADPRNDGERIMLMGFSRGGNAALYSAMTRFQDAFGPEHGRIVAHLPFYPACNFELVGELEVGPAPIREFHGGGDDWTPAAPCQDYIDRLAAAGHDAAMTVYPGALHAFDNEFTEPRVAGGAETSRNCRRVEVDGRLVNPETGRPFDYADACVERGPSMGYDAEATAAARAAVTGFLAEIFGQR
jgi:dienelactone hydrolase